MLILVLNLILNCVISFNLINILFRLEDLKSTRAINKPLFRKIMKIYTTFISPVFSFSALIYFFVYGPTIFQLLDYYHKVYNNLKLKFSQLIAFILFNVIMMFSTIKHDLEELHSIKPLELLMYLYIYNIFLIHDYLIWAIVAYYKYGTYRLLCDIHHNLIHYSSTQFSEVDIFQTIQSLALHNHKLNQQISHLLLYFFCVNVTFTVIVFTVFLLEITDTYNYDYVIYMIIIFICFIVAVHFSNKTDMMLNTLDSTIRRRYLWSITKKNLNPFLRSGKHPVRCLFQISIYRKYFQLSLFDCITIDYNFVLCLIIFISSNILIIIQTN